MRQKCFVLMDFSERYRIVYEKTIKPTVEKLNLSCIRGDEIRMSGDILGQILAEIQSASVIVADLTGNNTNVAYEVGYAHHLGIKTVLISQSLENIPFDFRNQRIIYYSQTENGLEDLANELKKTIEHEIISPAAILKKLIIPPVRDPTSDKYIIASSPLTFQEKKFRVPDVRRPLNEVESYAEYVGITGLIQSFGLIFGLAVTPSLINPRDFDESSAFDPVNLYLLGSPKSNKWTKIVLDKIAEKWSPTWHFVAYPKSNDLRDPWVNLEKNNTLYEPSEITDRNRTKIDFGLIVRAPHPKYNNKLVLIMAGRTGLGTAASCKIATTPNHIISLINKWHIDISNFNQPFWAIASAERTKGSFNNIDRDSVKIVDAGSLKLKSNGDG